MGFPFTGGERQQLKDCCGWSFEGDIFLQPNTAALPDDEISPWQQMVDWKPWIEECLVLLDGDGAYNTFPYPGTYRQQPGFDMEIHQCIRQEFNRLKNAKMKNQQNDLSSSIPKIKVIK